MPLEDLVSLIERLSQRINHDGPSLRRSEAQTCSVLIEPLLRALGWDTADFAHVRTQYRVGALKADYALLTEGEPRVLLETKSLDTPLDDAATQAFKYARTGSAPFFAMTNGSRWELHGLHKPASDTKVGEWDLSKEPAPEVARKALALWRRASLGTTAPVSAIPLPGVGRNEPTATAVSGSPVGVAPAIPNSISPVAQPPLGVWVSLNALPGATGYPAPKAIKFADGAEKPIASWPDVLVAVAEWLVSKGVLTAVGPVGITTRSHIINTTAEHPSGKFRKPRQLANGLYVETNVASDQLLKHANFLLGRFEQDAKDVQVRTS